MLSPCCFPEESGVRAIQTTQSEDVMPFEAADRMQGLGRPHKKNPTVPALGPYQNDDLLSPASFRGNYEPQQDTIILCGESGEDQTAARLGHSAKAGLE